MKIGFDLDKVFIDFPPFVYDKLIDRLYKQKTNGVLLYRIPSKPEQIIRIISHYPIFRPVMSENIKLIKSIKQNKNNSHKFYLISSRFGFLRKQTDKLIKKNNFHEIFDGMYFNYKNEQPHKFKNGVLNKLKIDRYVDDDLELLKFLNMKNKKTQYFWLNNHTKKIIEDNILSIKYLSEIFQ